MHTNGEASFLLSDLSSYEVFIKYTYKQYIQMSYYPSLLKQKSDIRVLIYDKGISDFSEMEYLFNLWIAFDIKGKSQQK